MSSEMRGRVALVLVVLGVLSSAVVASASSPATGNHTRNSMTVAPRASERPAAVKQYWTPERMRAARPLDFVADEYGARSLNLVKDNGARVGSPRAVASGLPAPRFLERSAGRFPNRLAVIGDSSDARTNARYGSQSGGGQAVEIMDPSLYPYRTHGKIFMTLPSGDYVCSGTVVPSTGKNLVWTAGHCLTLEGEWATNVLFVPGYRNGNAPFGEWVAELWGTDPTWAQYNMSEYDFGAMVMHANAAGDELADVVGWRGIVFNQSEEQLFRSYGYPSRTPFDGERAWLCESEWLGNDPYAKDPENPAMGIACDMTQGSSGGGWVIGDTIETAAVNSVNSYGKPIYPGVMFGPYQGSDAEALWETADGRTATATPTPFPTPVETVDTHEMELSFTLRKHLVAKGAVAAPDGYAACTRGAPVGLFKKTTSGWKFIKETATNNYSQYKIRLPDKPGRYVAYSIDGYVDDFNYCTDALSFIRIHRH